MKNQTQTETLALNKEMLEVLQELNCSINFGMRRGRNTKKRLLEVTLKAEEVYGRS